MLPNAWDAGSARILEQVGFPAIATTSAGIAWALGVRDGGAVDRDTMLDPRRPDRCRSQRARAPWTSKSRVCATLPKTSAETVARAAAIGAVGANIEDVRSEGLYDVDEAVDRIVAARAAAP